jgi:hypothetical protein
MEAMRESWTDERLDDFRGEVSQRFDGVDQRFDRVEAELRTQRLETKAEFASMRKEMGAGFESLQRLILQVGGGIIATLVGVFIMLVAG